MRDMNISKTHNCFGCGVCAIACAKHIISIELNADGFYEPRITEPDKCTDCGLCMEVCSFSHDDLALKNPDIKPYAAWSKDPAVRRKCSSGGVGFEVGRTVVAEGGKVCCVRFNAEKNQAEHYVASTDQELIPSIGSKYIQSYTVDGFAEVARLMRESRKKGENAKFLITGTPCQIDSFRRWAQKFKCEDQFIFLDFFCHGVPSKLMWDKYVKHVEKEVGKITYVSWRNKFTGWHDSWAMAIDGEQKGCEPVNWHDSYNLLIREKKSYLNSRLSQGDVFYRLFLWDFCMNPACQKNCRFKMDQSSADIRIGDAWGKTYKKNDEGVSAAIAFTPKGKALLDTCNAELLEHSFAEISEAQQTKNCGKAATAGLIGLLLKMPFDIPNTVWKLAFLPEHVIRTCKWHLKKLKR